MIKVTSRSLEETNTIASEWLKEVTKEHANSTGALVVCLSGQLGAGKTAFTKAVAKELGITEEVTSPTFVIMKMYDIVHPHWKKLIHIDAYRLERGEELAALGFEKLANDPGNLIIIEWPENVKEALGSLFTKTIIYLSASGDQENEREISFETP